MSVSVNVSFREILDFEGCQASEILCTCIVPINPEKVFTKEYDGIWLYMSILYDHMAAQPRMSEPTEIEGPVHLMTPVS